MSDKELGGQTHYEGCWMNHDQCFINHIKGEVIDYMAKSGGDGDIEEELSELERVLHMFVGKKYE